MVKLSNKELYYSYPIQSSMNFLSLYKDIEYEISRSNTSCQPKTVIIFMRVPFLRNRQVCFKFRNLYSDNMKGTINIEYPESLANILKLSLKEFESEIKTASLVKLYELGRISSGVAAKVLGISRLDFLELLAEYNVSVVGKYDMDDLNQDIANA